MRPRQLALLLAVTLTTSAHALSIYIDLESEVRELPVVAWVQIEGGSLLAAPDGTSCGAKYVGRVIRAVKGVEPGALVNFGYHSGYKVGAQYFVFLESGETVLRRSSSAAARPSMVSPVPYLASCRPLMPDYVVIGEGVGAIPIESGDRLGYKPAISLSNPPYSIPAALTVGRQYKGMLLDGQLFGSLQVEAAVFHEYLRSLVSK